MQLLKKNRTLLKWLKCLPILLLALLFSFSSNPKHKYIHIVDLPDSYFAYKNLSTSLIKRFYYDNINNDNIGNFYKDSTKKFKLFCLDNNQKKKILPRITGIKDNLDTSFIACCMECILLAKQSKIGAFTPIIFLAGADDYSELIYVLLDENDKPVSHFSLAGSFGAGPMIETDSLSVDQPFKVSHIKGNIISSYILHTQFKRGSDTLATIDSVSYKTVISKNGEIRTSRIDSERYERYTGWNPFTFKPPHRNKPLK